jgi:uncharacterized protein
MERRFVSVAAHPVRLEKRADGKPMICGYASVFYREDDPGTEYALWDDLAERIMPGAFDRAMKEDDCRALVNHEPSALLGRTASGTLRLAIDQTGLRYEIDPPDTQAARDVMESIKRGDMTGSSFTFVARDVTWREQGDRIIREIRDVQLYDVGPVTFPAYGSTTAGLRSLGEPEEARRAMEAWKASGKGNGGGLAAVLAGYQARARSVEVMTWDDRGQQS